MAERSDMIEWRITIWVTARVLLRPPSNCAEVVQKF